MEKYLIVIHPSESVISMVKSMKEALAKEVGWFQSKNSVAHITICLFNANDKSLKIIKNKLRLLCATFTPFEVLLNEFGSYPNGAYFIAPDIDSTKRLTPIMKQVHDALNYVPDLKINQDPHLSIARRLTPHKLNKAKKLFTLVDMSFLCDNIVLKKFDENLKQYSLIDTFSFKEK